MVIGTIYIVFAKQQLPLPVRRLPHHGRRAHRGLVRRVPRRPRSFGKKDYVDADLFRNSGRYGDVRVIPVVTTIVASVIGWGLVTNSGASWLTWQGYLLGPVHLGGKTGNWAYANLGVFAALVLELSRHGPSDQQAGAPARGTRRVTGFRRVVSDDPSASAVAVARFSSSIPVA